MDITNKYRTKDGYVLSRNQCSLLIRVDGEQIEFPVSFGLSSSEVKNLYPFLIQACDKKITNPAMHFGALSKDSAFSDISDDDYSRLIKFVQKESLYWSSKPAASILELAMRISVDIALDPEKGIRNVLESMGIIVTDAPLSSQGKFRYAGDISSTIRSEVDSIMKEVINDDEYVSPLEDREDDKYDLDNPSTGVDIYSNWSSGDLDDDADRAAIAAYDREIAEMEARIYGKPSTPDRFSAIEHAGDASKSNTADDLNTLRDEITSMQNVYSSGMQNIDAKTKLNAENDDKFTTRVAESAVDHDYDDLDESIDSYLCELTDEEYDFMLKMNGGHDSIEDNYDDNFVDDVFEEFDIDDEDDEVIEDDKVVEDTYASQSAFDSQQAFASSTPSVSSVDMADENDYSSSEDKPSSDDDDDSFIHIYGSFADDIDDDDF